MFIVPSVAEPPVLPFTDQVTAVFVVPDTAALNEKESPARIFAVGGDTSTLIVDGGGGGGGLVPRVVAAQPAVDSDSKTLPRWSKLRIFKATHREPLNAVCSLRDGSVWGYWTKGQKWANVRGEKQQDAAHASYFSISEAQFSRTERGAALASSDFVAIRNRCPSALTS